MIDHSKRIVCRASVWQQFWISGTTKWVCCSNDSIDLPGAQRWALARDTDIDTWTLLLGKDTIYNLYDVKMVITYILCTLYIDLNVMQWPYQASSVYILAIFQANILHHLCRWPKFCSTRCQRWPLLATRRKKPDVVFHLNLFLAPYFYQSPISFWGKKVEG